MSLQSFIIILFIAIAQFFVLRWVLKRFISNQRVKNWLAALIGIIAAPVIYTMLIYAYFSYLFYEPQFDFDRDRWLADEQKRFEMRDDIVESKILLGKTETELIELIGEPSHKDSTGIWNYNLGMSGAGFGWQFNHLEVTFENAKVSKVEKIEIKD